MKIYQNACLLCLVLISTACSNSNTPNISLPLEDDTSTPVLSIDNYTNVVAHTLTFFTNEQFPGPRLTTIAPSAFTQSQNSITDATTGIETHLFSCSNGGEATRVFNTIEPDSFQFNNCQYEDAIFNGQHGLIIGKYNSVREYLDFSADINGGTATHEITGATRFKSSSPPCGIRQRSRDFTNYKITLSDQQFEIKDWNTTYQQATPAQNLCDADTLEIGGQFSVRSIDTNNNWLKVAATQTLTGTSNNPTAGVIMITAEDASSININFATDSNSTARVTITNNNGENTFEEPLTTWLDSLLP